MAASGPHAFVGATLLAPCGHSISSITSFLGVGPLVIFPAHKASYTTGSLGRGLTCCVLDKIVNFYNVIDLGLILFVCFLVSLQGMSVVDFI